MKKQKKNKNSIFTEKEKAYYKKEAIRTIIGLILLYSFYIPLGIYAIEKYFTK